MEKITKEFYLVEDWVDFDKSSLESISREYYTKKGMDAFVKKGNVGVIPHIISTSLVHAYNVANIFKNNIHTLPVDRKLRILECGSGSGIFARHFLIAAQDLGFLDRIELIISDFSEQSLRHIKEHKVLEGFIENEHYRFLVLNLLDFTAAANLEDNSINLKDIDLAILNYVVDALPMIPLAKNADGSFSKQQIRILSKSNSREKDIVNNTSYLSNLMIEYRWVPYDVHLASDLEKEFFDIFSDLTVNHLEGWQSRYSYGILAALKSLNSILSDNGMIYIADIPSPLLTKQQNKHYMLFGNSKANYINENLIMSYLHSLAYSSLNKREADLARIILCKNPNATANKNFREFFLDTNTLEKLLAISIMFQQIKDSSLSDVAKVLLDKLLEIDNQSSTALTFQGSYHFLNKNYEKALDFYKQARELDFSSSWNLDHKISGVEMFI
jgi:hypothetical protein